MQLLLRVCLVHATLAILGLLTLPPLAIHASAAETETQRVVTAKITSFKETGQKGLYEFHYLGNVPPSPGAMILKQDGNKLAGFKISPSGDAGPGTFRARLIKSYQPLGEMKPTSNYSAIYRTGTPSADPMD